MVRVAVAVVVVMVVVVMRSLVKTDDINVTFSYYQHLLTL